MVLPLFYNRIDVYLSNIDGSKMDNDELLEAALNDDGAAHSLFDDLDDDEMVFEEIPSQFFPFDTDKPFLECTLCGKSLSGPDAKYIVEKAVKNYSTGSQDTIFEYACCEECYKEMSGKISKDSMKALMNFNLKYMHNTMLHLRASSGDKLQTCFYTQKPVSESSEYQFFAIFKGDKMATSFFPMAVSSEIIEQMQEVISTKTREELDDFGKKIYPKLPYFEQDWSFRPMFF